MAKLIQYQQKAEPVLTPDLAPDPGQPRAVSPADLKPRWDAQRLAAYAPLRIQYGDLGFASALLSELDDVAAQMRWRPLYPDRAPGKVNRVPWMVTAGHNSPVPFVDILPFSAYFPMVQNPMPPRRSGRPFPSQAADTPRVIQQVQETQPVPFDAILPPPPAYTRTAYPHRAPGLDRRSYLMPSFFYESREFGFSVWKEPGTTPIVTTWTEPGITPIVTTWHEPGITPIVTTWTEVS